MKEIIKEFNNYDEIEKFAEEMNGEILLEPRNQESSFKLIENKDNLELHYNLIYDIYIMTKNAIYESGSITGNYIHIGDNEEILKDYKFLESGEIPIIDMIDEYEKYEPILDLKSYSNVFSEAKNLISSKPSDFINFLSIKRDSNLTFKQNALLFAKEERFDSHKYFYHGKYLTKTDEYNLIISLLSIADDEPDFRKIITRLEDYEQHNNLDDDFKYNLLSTICGENFSIGKLDKEISTQIFAKYIGMGKNSNFNRGKLNTLNYNNLKVYDEFITNFLKNESRLKNIKVIDFGINNNEEKILKRLEEMKQPQANEIHEGTKKTKIKLK